MALCRKCGHKWNPLKAQPLKCPQCAQPKWWDPKKGEAAKAEAAKAEAEKPVTRVTKKAKVPAKTTLVCPACGESKGIVEWGTGHRCNDCKRNF